MSPTPHPRLPAAAWGALAWLGLHGLGLGMTAVLERRLGFFPIWFLDCVACSAVSVSFDYGRPFLGGLSYAALAMGGAAVAVLATRSRPRAQRLWGWLLVIAAAAHVVVTWPARYPGSLPPVLVAVGPPFVIATLGAVALASTSGRPRSSTLPGGRWSWSSVVAGVTAMLLLGGWSTLAASAVGVAAWWKADPKERSLVIGGLSLAGLSGILRGALVSRYPAHFWWL